VDIKGRDKEGEDGGWAARPPFRMNIGSTSAAIAFMATNFFPVLILYTLDHNFPQLKSIRVFPTRFYLSYLGMKVS
jgi:hypothetical protein